MGPGQVWTGAKNLAATGIRSPDRPARSKSLYRQDMQVTAVFYRVCCTQFEQITEQSQFGAGRRVTGSTPCPPYRIIDTADRTTVNRAALCGTRPPLSFHE